MARRSLKAVQRTATPAKQDASDGAEQHAPNAKEHKKARHRDRNHHQQGGQTLV
eukprot:CAMPEP_0185700918 /NCGR_PEP_ID=MMETSP1164-20130828/8056_1 /TAXON_ID=1104430 /ORGANISM="Chrysoreinhardia sp, Strain CCMP2950" /LENGTH=53 /DNA_ID=CAMNT_0028367885 /DNA_START=78 /DNA_END=239 /DNA_ORIENTATION=+